MIEILPKLYSRIGFLIDHPPKLDWMEGTKVYDLNSLANELKQLSKINLFNKLIEILIANRVNLDYFGPLIGNFDKIGNSIIHCSNPIIMNLFQATIHFEQLAKAEYKLAKSFHFHFNERIILDEPNKKLSIKQNSYNQYPNFNVTVSYPIFSDKNIVYTNQLLVLYNQYSTE